MNNNIIIKEMIIQLINNNTINFFFSSITPPKCKSCCKVCHSFGCALGTTSSKECNADSICSFLQNSREHDPCKKLYKGRKDEFRRFAAMYELYCLCTSYELVRKMGQWCCC